MTMTLLTTLTTAPPSASIPLSYRHIYKTALRSIRYSTPTRYLIRNTLRTAYRKGNASDFDATKIVNTISFLERAGTTGTMERKILKTWGMVRYWEQPGVVGGVPLYVFCFLLFSERNG